MPLSGVRVVDLTSARSGPMCTRILADFGADVIWIERPGEPSFLRESFDEVDLHRGEKSVILDLGNADGVEVLNRLVVGAEVFVENYRPRVNDAGVSCGPIYQLNQVFADPQVQHAQLVSEVRHPLHGPVKVLGIPVTLHRTPGKITEPSPVRGEHTRKVLAGLGYDQEMIASLVARGVAGEARG